MTTRAPETETWYEVEDRYGPDRDCDIHQTLDEARAVAARKGKESPKLGPYRIIRVTETREEVI